MKLNADKCHHLVIGQRCDDPVAVKIGNAEVVNSSEFILISNSPWTITSRSFAKKPAIDFMHWPAYPRIWIRTKLRNLMRAFITSQFQHCPLIWMFHSRQLNQKINKMQERALRITYKDTESTLNELHTKNLQILMMEM